MSVEGKGHDRTADEVKGYEACNGNWRKDRWPQLRLIIGGDGPGAEGGAISHTVTLSSEIFEQLLAAAPRPLVKQAMDGAKRAILALCFTEADIRRMCEEDERWATLSPETQAEVVESLFDCGEYEHATVTGNEAIAEAVDRCLDEAIVSSI